jgi:hypothetical protein
MYLAKRPNRRRTDQSGTIGKEGALMTIYEIISVLLNLAMLVVMYRKEYKKHKKNRPDLGK